MDPAMLHRAALALTAALMLMTACSRPPAPTGPTPVPEPPQIRELPGRGVAVEGHGSATSDEVVPQYGGGLTVGIDVVTLTHNGQSTFIVTALQGQQSENVATAIGAYKGQRPLVVQGPVSFQVTADGAWTLQIQPLPSGGKPAFSGTGDAVSPYFPPPQPQSWNVAHDGQSAFFVYAHCLGGSIVVEDKTGVFQDTPQVEFPRGPCFWEVRADGAWNLTPAP
jgi:hypothetical protein